MLSFVAFSFFEKDENKQVVKRATTSRCQGSKIPTTTNHHVVNRTTTDLTHFAPTLPIYVFRLNPHLEIAFDVRTRNPVYVLERLPVGNDNNLQLTKSENDDLSSSSSAHRRRRRPNFYEETSLPEMFRSRNGHYRHTGYDRGHLAPAADFMGNNYQLVQDTFNLCNVSPQDPSLNRFLWAKLELWTRQVAQREWREHQNLTLVVTGPLWLPVGYHSSSSSTQPYPIFEYRYPAVGQPPCLLSVPTHFFKVVAVVAENSKDADAPFALDKFACFVVPNQKVDESSRLNDYLVRWSDLEAVVGMRLFPQLITQPSMMELADVLTDEVRELVTKSQPNHHVLRLTDGSQSPASSVARRLNKVNTKNRPTLEHLCSRGSCR